MGNYTFGVGVEPHKRWPVAWFNPFVLLQSARELLSSTDVIRNADPRDIWSGTFKPVDHAHEAGADGNFWFDFVSDTGDGGNATFTVARALLAEELAPQETGASGTVVFPRGKILYLGGDLCYPSANVQEYQYRFLEVFEGARSTQGADPDGRSAYAIPQNHDWFDSISTFKRYFVHRNNGEVCGLKTPQTRSYFATLLPQRWWVLGLDFALAGDIDRGQYEAFRRLAGDAIGGEDNPSQQMQAGDQVILIYPEPYWTRPIGDSALQGYPKRYQRLEAMLEAKGIHIRMRLAGDVHHYSRESSEPLDARQDDMLLTCGSGGAFLHPTHARALTQAKLKCQASDPDAISSELRTATHIGTVGSAGGAGASYVRQCAYPDPADSRALSRGNVLSLFKFAWNSLSIRDGSLMGGIWRGNVLFSMLLGAIYVVTVFGGPFTSMAYLALLGLCLGLAREESGLFAKWVSPVLHFAGHTLALLGIHGLVAMVPATAGSPMHVILAGFVYLVAGTIGGGLITGGYLWVMARAGWMWNNAFSPLACEDYKGFLRFRIDAEGTLTGYFFGCDKVPKQWQRNSSDQAGPAGDVRPAWTEAPGVNKATWRLVDTFSLMPRS